MDTTLRLGEPRELLALIPHQLGFRPLDSAVAVSLRPPAGEVGLVVRVDLAALADDETGPRLARGLVAHLDRDGARRCVLALYTDQDPRGLEAHPVHRAAARLREAAQVPLGDVPAWVVTLDGYLALDCDEACCPPGGRPLHELESTQVGARMVLAGSVVAATRDDVARIRRAPVEARRSVARVRRRWEERRAAAAEAGPQATAAWRVGSVEAWRRATDPDVDGRRPASGSPLGRVEAGLADRRVRDAVLVSLVPGTGDLPERAVRGAGLDARADAAVGAAVAAIVDPQVAVRPPDDVRRYEQVLEQVVAHGRDGGQAPALTLLALVSWWRGDGARASVLLDRALAQEAGHRLALLLVDALEAAVPPGWVRAGGEQGPPS
ncbi:DUF4192 domain-containing protein [Cellulomonas soli]|uniref:DUF4192 domain-containing protein n=1 Tax=Cellulomonas soli TaxID=931535 RepID=A0A512P9T4_9CELL|nr:DUF4192 domain-containing protein [Cellulomonas soli]NYI60445.1 hypothetical protein [Cellulomonas soli]GEP67960.1 hypothetical protein CSO01_06750 [Cellulomonas soli]